MPTLKMKVAIDPGHGMSNRTPGDVDPGTTATIGGVTFRECDIALEFGLALRDHLESKQIATFMTRAAADDPAPLSTRASRAQRAGATHFVSLHLNSDEEHQGRGLEVLYGKPSDRGFAETLQRALVRTSGLRDRGAQTRSNLAVLRFPRTAALIELGFLHHGPDRKALLDAVVRGSIVEAISAVLMASFETPLIRESARAGRAGAGGRGHASNRQRRPKRGARSQP